MRRTADGLEFLLPADVRAQLDLATLVVCSTELPHPTQRHAETDLLYSLRTRSGGEALIYVLFEHQSSFDSTMPLRLLRYMVRIWEQWRDSHPEARLLPVIVPIVLHHGDAAWRAPPELAAMIDASPEMLEATRPWVPHFRFILDDLAALSLDALGASEASHLQARSPPDRGHAGRVLPSRTQKHLYPALDRAPYAPRGRHGTQYVICS